MQTLIDELGPLEAPDTDPNYYRTGLLPSKDPQQSHRVLITVLAQDGTRSAATACTDVLRSFPDLQVVIMVGIAGGIPAPSVPARHVRLGDVVVATDGIIDYDHVHTVDGTDRLRRHVAGVSHELLRATRELRIGSVHGTRPWEQWSGPSTDPTLIPFVRPDESTDILRLGGTRVDHPPRDLSGHFPAAPKVHYGAIASADRLLRDEARRDELAHRHAVLAVEMEGSGIAVSATMHDRQWLVVRGVADYCNTDKHDGWHSYAALSAAAYTRALLAQCRPFRPRNGHQGSSAGPTNGFPAHLSAEASPRVAAATQADGVGLHSARPAPRGRWDFVYLLVELLTQIPIVIDPQGRQAVVDQLRPAIRGAVRRNPALRMDVFEIVRTCVDYNGGPAELVQAVLRLDDESEPARRLVEMLRSAADPAISGIHEG